MQVSTELTISRGSCSCQLRGVVRSGKTLCCFGLLDLPRVWVDLAELDLVRCYWLALAIEN